MTWNVVENMILHEIFRGVSRFPRYFSCYIAENWFSLGQCRAGSGCCLYLVRPWPWVGRASASAWSRQPAAWSAPSSSWPPHSSTFYTEIFSYISGICFTPHSSIFYREIFSYLWRICKLYTSFLHILHRTLRNKFYTSFLHILQRNI